MILPIKPICKKEWHAVMAPVLFFSSFAETHLKFDSYRFIFYEHPKIESFDDWWFFRTPEYLKHLAFF